MWHMGYSVLEIARLRDRRLRSLRTNCSPVYETWAGSRHLVHRVPNLVPVDAKVTGGQISSLC